MTTHLADFQGVLYEVPAQELLYELRNAIRDVIPCDDEAFAIFFDNQIIEDEPAFAAANLQQDSLLVVRLVNDLCDGCGHNLKLEGEKYCDTCKGPMKGFRVEVRPDGYRQYYKYVDLLYQWTPTSARSFPDDYEEISSDRFCVDPAYDPLRDGYLLHRETKKLIYTRPWHNVKETFPVEFVDTSREEALQHLSKRCDKPEALLEIVKDAVLCRPKKYCIVGTRFGMMLSFFLSIFGSQEIDRRISGNFTAIHCSDEPIEGMEAVFLTIKGASYDPRAMSSVYSSAFL